MKFLFVTTISNTLNAFLIPHIRDLVDSGHTVDVASHVVVPISDEILSLGCRSFDIPFERAPMSKRNKEAYRIIRKTISDGGYDVVHTHTPVASFVTRMACRNISGVKMIYTTHGLHFHSGAPSKNWMVYYPAERIASRYTDLLITINHEDYERAKKLLHAKRVEYIPGIGLDIEKYRVPVDREEKRKSLGIGKDDFLVLSVGELNYNKNHATVIKALAKMKDPSVKYIVCGEGPLKSELASLSESLNVSGQVMLLGERDDVAEIYNISDLFAFPSRREGLGMAALEAMDAGLPIVTSNVHGIVDYSVDGVTGYLCGPEDADAFAQNIARLKADSSLREKMSEHNREAVKRFELKNVRKKLASIYREIGVEVKSDE